MASNEDIPIRHFVLKAAEAKVEHGSNDAEDYADRFDFDFDVQDMGF
ncbi:MAG: hypothetical protein AAGB15_02975 [Pseudomonadota bacterium]